VFEKELLAAIGRPIIRPQRRIGDAQKPRRISENRGARQGGLGERQETGC